MGSGASVRFAKVTYHGSKEGAVQGASSFTPCSVAQARHVRRTGQPL